MWKKKICIALLFCCLSIEAKENEFIVLTIPKCGTGLINKFFELSSMKRKYPPNEWLNKYLPNAQTSSFEIEGQLTDKMINEVFKHCRQKKLYPFSHLNYAKPFMRYIDRHKDWRCLLQIRDLRDACISMVYWKSEKIEEVLGPNATFDDKLLFVIKASESRYKNSVFNLKASAERAAALLSHPNVVVSRYEDLVGERGGGNDAAQKELIRTIANRLSIPMPKKKLEEITSILWGNDQGPYKPTFRKGEINRWKEIFTLEHKEAFKKHFGNLLIKLGYEKNNNW